MQRRRILQVVGAMNRGGTETWLTQVARRLDPARFDLHFLVHSTEPAAYDRAIQAAGTTIVRCPNPHNPLVYARNFAELVRHHGPYHAVHSHLHYFSGFVLRLARWAGIPQRMAHSHSSDPGPDRLGCRAGYVSLSRHWIRRYATAGLAVSEPAARALFGARWRKDGRWRLQPCGIDFAPYRQPPNRQEVRGSLGLPMEATVVGHTGRFVDEKNHAFFLQVAAEILRRDPRSHYAFVFAGDGPLRPSIEARAAALGLPCHFLGNRADVPNVLTGAFDLFLFPSKREGLGLALLEAQAAGLRCIVSSSVPDEAAAIPELVDRLSLDLPAPVWARAVLSALRRPVPGKEDALAAMARSRFTIESSVEALEEMYGS